MIRLAVNNKQFKKDMDNIVKYSFGYLEGIQIGKVEFFHNLGLNILWFKDNGPKKMNFSNALSSFV